MKYKFPVIYWSKKSTKVQFESFTELPKNAPVTSCMVFVKKDGSILLSKPDRGWGLPGGHKELTESPEECAVREVAEETNVNIKNIKLVGGWKAQKIRHIESNSKYPEVAYQLLFIADVAQICKFSTAYESKDRMFVKFSDIKKYHHDYGPFSEILVYVLDFSADNDG